MEFGTTAVVLLIVFGVIVIVIKTLVIVPQGFEYTRERLGKFADTMPPGPHLADSRSSTGGPQAST